MPNLLNSTTFDSIPQPGWKYTGDQYWLINYYQRQARFCLTASESHWTSSQYRNSTIPYQPMKQAHWKYINILQNQPNLEYHICVCVKEWNWSLKDPHWYHSSFKYSLVDIYEESYFGRIHLESTKLYLKEQPSFPTAPAVNCLWCNHSRHSERL